MKKLSIDKKLDKIIKLQEKILEKETEIEKEEKELVSLGKKELSEEDEILKAEKEELEELKKIEVLEKDILKASKSSTLKKVTYRDITKGMIGAFFGIMGHFAFVKGTSIAKELSMARASGLFIASFGLLIIFLYFAGFKKINDKLIMKFLPLRAVVIYLSAIFTIFIVLLLYGNITVDTNFADVYKAVGAISILAVLGAATADLVGKVEE
ncbi:MAG: DUF2391 family protein [Candidatus Woesearchaeota archaeon]